MCARVGSWSIFLPLHTLHCKPSRAPWNKRVIIERSERRKHRRADDQPLERSSTTSSCDGGSLVARCRSVSPSFVVTVHTCCTSRAQSSAKYNPHLTTKVPRKLRGTPFYSSQAAVRDGNGILCGRRRVGDRFRRLLAAQRTVLAYIHARPCMGSQLSSPCRSTRRHSFHTHTSKAKQGLIFSHRTRILSQYLSSTSAPARNSTSIASVRWLRVAAWSAEPIPVRCLFKGSPCRMNLRRSHGMCGQVMVNRQQSVCSS